MSFLSRLFGRSRSALPLSDLVLTVELEQEEDGRWIAEVDELPGVMAYGATQREAVLKAAALALRVVADRVEHNEYPEAALTVKLVPRECLASL